jgi:hypothetical protein
MRAFAKAAGAWPSTMNGAGDRVVAADHRIDPAGFSLGVQVDAPVHQRAVGGRRYRLHRIGGVHGPARRLFPAARGHVALDHVFDNAVTGDAVTPQPFTSLAFKLR